MPIYGLGLELAVRVRLGFRVWVGVGLFTVEVAWCILKKNCFAMAVATQNEM